MIKDLPENIVKDIAIAVALEKESAETKLWYVYLINLNYISGVSPVEVTLSGYAIQVGSYCGKYDDIGVDMYFRQTWNDPRLVLELKGNEKGNGIRLGHGFNPATIWTPDTFFANSRKGSKLILMNPNRWFHIHENGNVLYSER